MLELDDLFNGDFFGDDCLILKKPIRHSMVTAMPSEILTLDIHDFMQLGKDVHEHCLLAQKSYPEDSDLRRAFIEMSRWTKFKKDVVHSVRSENTNKKRSFENQLRKPAQMPVKMPIKASVKDEGAAETYLKETDVLSTNYLASASYIFKAAKQKREMIEQQMKLLRPNYS